MSSYSDDYKNSQTQLNALTRRLYEIDEEKMPLTALEVKSLLDDALAFISNSPRELDLTVECYSIRDAFRGIRFSLPKDVIGTLFKESKHYDIYIHGKSHGKKHKHYAYTVIGGLLSAYKSKFGGLLKHLSEDALPIKSMENYPSMALHSLIAQPNDPLKRREKGGINLLKMMMANDALKPAELAEYLHPGQCFSDMDTYRSMAEMIDDVNYTDAYISTQVNTLFHPLSGSGVSTFSPIENLLTAMHIYMETPEKRKHTLDMTKVPVNLDALSDADFIRVGRGLIADTILAEFNTIEFWGQICERRPGITMSDVVTEDFLLGSIDYCLSRFEIDDDFRRHKNTLQKALLQLYTYSQPNPALINHLDRFTKEESTEVMSALMAEYTRYQVNFNQEKPASKHKADFNNLVL